MNVNRKGRVRPHLLLALVAVVICVVTFLGYWDSKGQETEGEKDFDTGVIVIGPVWECGHMRPAYTIRTAYAKPGDNKKDVAAPRRTACGQTSGKVQQQP